MKIVNAECIVLDIPFYADHGPRRLWRRAQRMAFYRRKGLPVCLLQGQFSRFQEGIDLTVVEDDGSDAFARGHVAILTREEHLLMDELR